MQQTLLVAINAGSSAAGLHLPAPTCPGRGTTLTPLFGAAQSSELDADHWNLDLAGRTAAIWLRTEIA